MDLLVDQNTWMSLLQDGASGDQRCLILCGRTIVDRNRIKPTKTTVSNRNTSTMKTSTISKSVSDVWDPVTSTMPPQTRGLKMTDNGQSGQTTGSK